jgi:hypothetical protein
MMNPSNLAFVADIVVPPPPTPKPVGGGGTQNATGHLDAMWGFWLLAIIATVALIWRRKRPTSPEGAAVVMDRG